MSSNEFCYLVKVEKVTLSLPLQWNIFYWNCFCKNNRHRWSDWKAGWEETTSFCSMLGVSMLGFSFYSIPIFVLSFQVLFDFLIHLKNYFPSTVVTSERKIKFPLDLCSLTAPSSMSIIYVANEKNWVSWLTIVVDT